MGLASIRWDPLFRLNTCEEKYLYYQTIINNLMEHCFPIMTVTWHTADKQWITDLFRNRIRKRQRAEGSFTIIDNYESVHSVRFLMTPPQKRKPLL